MGFYNEREHEFHMMWLKHVRTIIDQPFGNSWDLSMVILGDGLFFFYIVSIAYIARFCQSPLDMTTGGWARWWRDGPDSGKGHPFGDILRVRSFFFLEDEKTCDELKLTFSLMLDFCWHFQCPGDLKRHKERGLGQVERFWDEVMNDQRLRHLKHCPALVEGKADSWDSGLSGHDFIWQREAPRCFQGIFADAESEIVNFPCARERLVGGLEVFIFLFFPCIYSEQ